MFDSRRKDYLYVAGSTNPEVIIGAPHSTNKRYPIICNNTVERLGDIGTGELAEDIYLLCSELGIQTKLIIKNRELNLDPNKYTNTEYYNEIFKENAILLVEIHGSGKKSVLPIEISSGNNNTTKLTKFGLYIYEEQRQLQKRKEIDWIYAFIVQEIPKTNKGILFLPTGTVKSFELRLPALNTKTMEQNKIHTIHIELREKFRYSSKKDKENIKRIISNSIYKYIVDKDFTD